MTTDSAPFEGTLVRARSFAWERAAAAFLIVLAGVLVMALAFAVGYSRVHDGRIFPGVSVAGVALGGLDRAEAEARLREALPALPNGELTVRFGEDQSSIRFSAIDRDYDTSLMLDQAFALGRGGDQAQQTLEQLGLLMRGTSIEPSLTWNGDALAEQLSALAAEAYTPAVDANIVRENGHFTVVPAQAGRTVDASPALAQATAELGRQSARSLTVSAEPVPIPPALSTEQAEAVAGSAARIAAEPLRVSAEGWSAAIEADVILGWIHVDEQTGGGWTISVERDPIVQAVQHYALEVDRPAQDATLTFEEGEAVAVPGSQGQVVDVEASADAIQSQLEARMNGGGAPQVNLALVVVDPDFTLEQAQELVSRVERLSRWRTSYQPGPLNYNGANIRIPTSKIDGIVLQPGETFDFWEVVGFPDPADGYGQGAAIIRGRTVPDGALAGGICSCSTTIFNAALRAGLEMGDRRNHYYYINRYPRGLDATVWLSRPGGPGQTVSFTNDMEHPVLIRGINRRASVIFEIWGVPEGRTVELTKPRVENRRPAYEVLEYRDDMRPGQTRRVEWPANGFDSWVTRTVRDAGGQVIHEETYFSKYARILGVTRVGRSEGDPPHKTRVRVGAGSVD